MPSITRRKNVTYQVQWYGGRDLKTGARFRLSKTCATYADAVSTSRAMAPTTGRGGSRTSTESAMIEYIEALEAMGRIRPSTAHQYRQTAARWGNLLGDKAVGRITHSDIQEALTTLARMGRSHGLIQNHKWFASGFFGWQLRAGAVTTNPCVGVIASASRRRSTTAPSKAQVDELLARAAASNACDGMLPIIITILAKTGLRRGEALALRWEDIDLNDRTLRVERTLIQIERELSYHEPKTEAGRRTVPIPASLAGALAQHRRAQLEGYMRSGVRMPPGAGLCVALRDGSPIPPNNVTLAVADLVRGIDGWPKGAKPVHGLRHYHGSALYASGALVKSIQNILGHAEPSTTLSLYVHETLDPARAAVDALDAL